MISEQQMKRFTDDVAPFCTRCPPPALRSAVERTIMDFCKSIGGIRHRLGPISANPDLHPGGVYYAASPFAGVVHAVTDVFIDGRRLAVNRYRVSLDNGRAEVVLFGNPRGILTMSIAWRPSPRTQQLPEAWLDKNFDAITHGVIADVLSQSGTAWANETLAARFAGDYSREIGDAIYELRAAEGDGGKLSCFDREATWL